MKKILFNYAFFILGHTFLKAQTILVAGDIAIVAYNADEVGNEDEFSFIL